MIYIEHTLQGPHAIEQTMRLAALAALCATVAARQDHLCEEDVCFYHVPKTGGDSFKYLLRDELIFGSFRRAFRAFSSFSSPAAVAPGIEASVRCTVSDGDSNRERVLFALGVFPFPRLGCCPLTRLEISSNEFQVNCQATCK